MLWFVCCGITEASIFAVLLKCTKRSFQDSSLLPLLAMLSMLNYNWKRAYLRPPLGQSYNQIEKLTDVINKLTLKCPKGEHTVL